jgi:hypothetical protein
MIKQFLKLSQERKSLKEPLIRSSLIDLKKKVSLYIRHGFSIEMMINREGNQALYKSVFALDLEMRNYDANLMNAELSDSGLKGIEKLLAKIEVSYRDANYAPQNIFSYILRQIKTSFKQVK